MKKQIDKVYMGMAIYLAQLSKSWRKKVGCLIVDYSNDIPRILAEGVNGTLPGYSNECEDENGVTYDHVIHAEANALNKVKGYDLKQCTLYVTFQPCQCCSKSIVKSGIKRVVYLMDYKDPKGIEYMLNNGVEVIKLSSDYFSDLNLVALDYSGYLRKVEGLNEIEIAKKVKLSRNVGEFIYDFIK